MVSRFFQPNATGLIAPSHPFNLKIEIERVKMLEWKFFGKTETIPEAVW